MAAWCSIADVRNANKDLDNETEVTDAVITERIATAQEQIEVDLNSVVSAADLASIAATSKTVKKLTIFKATEITLVKLYGNFRQADTVSDIDYFRKEYEKLLMKILSGEIILSSSLTTNAKDYPSVGTTTNQSFYGEKGVSGFYPDDDAVYDTVNN